MGLPELKADAKLLRERLAKMPADKIDAKYELVENIIPLFELMLDETLTLRDELGDQGRALDELIDQDSDVLHPETAAKFVAVVEVGKLMAKELEQAFPKLDDMAKKRVKQLLRAYRQGAEVLTELIQEITLPIEESTSDEEAVAQQEGDLDEGDEADLDDDQLEGDELASEEG